MGELCVPLQLTAADAPGSPPPLGMPEGARLAVFWQFGVCGVGAPGGGGGASAVGWDGLLAALACALNHSTVVLAASDPPAPLPLQRPHRLRPHRFRGPTPPLRP